jgi:predicted neuraminidase
MPLLCKSLSLIAIALCCANVHAAEPGLLSSEFIFEKAPFPSCHASTIAESKHGLVAAWFGGTEEKDLDVGIWVARQVNGRWTAPIEVANGVQYLTTANKEIRFPCWNPVLYQAPGGPLLLFYKVGPDPKSWWGMLTSSDDGGAIWSQPRRLPEQIAGPIKNKPVLLADGTLLAPTSSESDGWRVHFESTKDLGRTWRRTDALNDPTVAMAIQPSVLQLGGDKLLALGRTRQGKLFQITSEDNGKTWGPMTLGTLPNNNSGTDAVTLRDGRHLLIYNHTTKGRTPLNLALSENGVVWQAALVFENEPGEYSYPAIIQSADGLVHVTYTWKRERIRHAVIDPAKLELKPIVDGEWPK